MRKLVLALLLIAPLLPHSVMALPPASAMLGERAMGSEQAKVTIIEYSSLTCPHCAEFHRDTLPSIIAEYIDKGLVRYVFRDFPLEARALAASMVARCLPPDRYFGFLDLLFRDQQNWARSGALLEDLKLRAQLAGLSPADFDACLSDKELLDGIQDQADAARSRDGIDSTPMFLVDGRKLAGARSLAEFQSAINDALAKAR